MRHKFCYYLFLLVLVCVTPVYSASINGIWDFELNITHMVGSDGFVRREKRTFKWVVRFKQNGEILKGDLIGGKGSRGESVCADAAIEGTIKGKKVEFTVEYQGECCRDGQMKFVGFLNEDNTLSGKLEPVDIPSGTCSLAYADTSASKRESPKVEN